MLTQKRKRALRLTHRAPVQEDFDAYFEAFFLHTHADVAMRAAVAREWRALGLNPSVRTSSESQLLLARVGFVSVSCASNSAGGK